MISNAVPFTSVPELNVVADRIEALLFVIVTPRCPTNN
jgi:hypothetical protein